jgi:hypothetical protein
MALNVRKIVGKTPCMTDMELDRVIIEKIANTEFEKYTLDVK